MLPHMAPPVTKDFVLPKFPYMVCAKGGERIYNLGGRSLAEAALLIFCPRSSTRLRIYMDEEAHMVQPQLHMN